MKPSKDYWASCTDHRPSPCSTAVILDRPRKEAIGEHYEQQYNSPRYQLLSSMPPPMQLARVLFPPFKKTTMR